MHRQQQFHATGTRAHHRNTAGPLPGTHIGKQLQPARVESRNRFNRYGVFCRALHLRQLRGRTGVDGQQVIVQRRATVQ